MKKSTRGHSDPRPAGAVGEYRRPLFSVARVRVNEGAAAVEAGCDSWGRVRVVRGGVGQHHRDLLDAIRTLAEHRVTDAAGQEHLIFDDAKVRQALGARMVWKREAEAPGNRKGKALAVRTAWKDMRDDLLDMITTVVQIDGLADSWGAAFPLAAFVGDANSPAARAPHQYPAHLRRLVLSAGFSKLIEEQAAVGFSREVLARVLGLRHAVSRAVARWCLTHSKNQHHDLAAVLAAVGATKPGEAISGRGGRWQAREYARQVREDAGALLELGIDLDAAGRLHYHRQKGVFIKMAGPVVEKTQVVVGKTQVVVGKTQASKEFPLRKFQ